MVPQKSEPKQQMISKIEKKNGSHFARLQEGGWN
jgi:hypothetical protein